MSVIAFKDTHNWIIDIHYYTQLQIYMAIHNKIYTYLDIRSWIRGKSITESNKIYESYLIRLFSYISSTICYPKLLGVELRVYEYTKRSDGRPTGSEYIA